LEYLGLTICYDNEEELEIDKKVSKGSKAMGSLNRMLTSREISRSAKIRIYWIQDIEDMPDQARHLT
jgi:hypothetical protein